MFMAFIPVLAGILGIAVMDLVLKEEHHVHLPAIRYMDSLGRGLSTGSDRQMTFILHLLFGIFFAIIYLELMPVAMDQFSDYGTLIVVSCTLFGLVQGILTTYIMVAVTDEKDDPEGQACWNPVSYISYMVAYGAYGLTVGSVAALAAKLFF